MDGLRQLIHHASCPNLILYGPSPSPQDMRHRIGVKGVSTHHPDPAMNIVYYHNYSEFNVKYIKVNQVESWKRALEDCLKKTSYFTDSRRYIALTHFERCKPVIQDYLRVILETNPLTTFILFTTRYHAVREALRSRCIAIRIPQEPTIPSDFKTPVNKLSEQLQQIYNQDFETLSQNTFKELKRIASEIHKYNLSISDIMRDLVQHIMGNVKWPHALKYKVIEYLATQESTSRHSYRSLIHTEAILVQVYHLLSSEHYDDLPTADHEVQSNQEEHIHVLADTARPHKNDKDEQSHDVV